MKHRLHWIFTPYMAPAGDDGSTGGGTVDRGDDFDPTGDDAKKPEPVKSEVQDEPKDPLDDDDTDPPEDDPDDEDKPEEGLKGEKKPEGKKDTRLPLSRHKEILEAERNRREAVERELAQYKQGKAIASTNEEITALEDKVIKAEGEYAKLMADGELDKAASKMREIRVTEREINDKRVNMSVAAAEARAVEQVRYDATVDRMEEAYPALNPSHEDFDKEKVAEVLELKAAYQGRGYTPTDALQKAIKLIMGAATKAQERATETTPRVSAEDEAKAKAEARRKTQRDKNIDAASKQPADLKKVGQDSDKMGGSLDAKAVMKMSYDDFRKLSDDDLAKMRGDEVEA